LIEEWISFGTSVPEMLVSLLAGQVFVAYNLWLCLGAV